MVGEFKEILECERRIHDLLTEDMIPLSIFENIIKEILEYSNVEECPHDCGLVTKDFCNRYNKKEICTEVDRDGCWIAWSINKANKAKYE